MYTGMLITDFLLTAERVRNSHGAHTRDAIPTVPSDSAALDKDSEAEQFPQTLGLRTAHGNLSLLFVVHPKLVRALEPRHDFADAIDIDKIGAMSTPE